MARDIVVNGRFLSRRVSGVERYGRSILPLLGNDYRIEKTRWNGARGHMWEQFILPAKINRGSVLWSPANTGPLWIREQAVTVHDLSPLEHPEWFRMEFACWYRSFLPRLVRRAGMIFTPSEYVKRKIEERFGVGNVIVARNGVDHSTFHPEAEQNLRGLPERYVLFVGSLEPRKNLNFLLRSWERIKAEYENVWLLVAGEAGTVFRTEKYPVTERVRFLGYVAEEALPGLYANAECFVIPSHDEGFGLSVLEAMACGTPVIVSDGGALPETVGQAGLVFHLSDPDGLRDALRECMSDQQLRSVMSEKGREWAAQFSWENTAKVVRDCLHGF